MRMTWCSRYLLQLPRRYLSTDILGGIFFSIPYSSANLSHPCNSILKALQFGSLRNGVFRILLPLHLFSSKTGNSIASSLRGRLLCSLESIFMNYVYLCCLVGLSAPLPCMRHPLIIGLLNHLSEFRGTRRDLVGVLVGENRLYVGRGVLGCFTG